MKITYKFGNLTITQAIGVVWLSSPMDNYSSCSAQN